MRAGRPPRAFATAALLATLAFLYAPIVLVVVFSFNASRLVTVWGGASLHWYGALADDVPLREAALLSGEVALLSGLAATLAGTLAALVLVRRPRSAEAAFVSAAIYAPLVTPDVVAGLSLLLVFVALGIERGIGTLVLAHAALSTPFVAILVRAKLATIGRIYEDVAADLGAGPAAAFFTVTLPLAAPAIAAGFMLAFTLSLDDLVVASFASGPGATTLPMRIYSQMRLGVSPEINAVATLLIAAAAAAVTLATLLVRGGSRGSALP